METGTPSLTKVVTMVLFALSCAGLLLFLWLSFGGTIPFNAQGYRVRISFPNAGQLATQADVRIAGVTVGKVIDKSLDPVGNRTIATMQIDRKYAPIRQDATAILRLKTILGETYVEITPGTPNSPPLPDGGLLARGHVQRAVQLDEVFNSFDEPTRRAFQIWQQATAVAIGGNALNLNGVLGNLPTFAADTTDILRVLDVEHTSVVKLVRNGGTVFGALGANQTALRSLITNGEATFATTAANNQALADTFHTFPTFLDETRRVMTRLKGFALDTDPLTRELLPVAANLTPTLAAVRQLSPDLRHLFVNLGPLITVSQTGMPAIRDVLIGAKPLLGAVGPFLSQLNPILDWLSYHQQLTSDFISNGAAGLSARTSYFGTTGTGHYLRQFQPTGSETLALYPNRDANNRGNTYPPPLWLADPKDFTAGGQDPTGNSVIFPAWDCKNAGGWIKADTTPATGHPACWEAAPLPGAPGKYKIPHILPKRYSSR